jgi:hypothetical protein
MSSCESRLEWVIGALRESKEPLTIAEIAAKVRTKIPCADITARRHILNLLLSDEVRRHQTPRPGPDGRPVSGRGHYKYSIGDG